MKFLDKLFPKKGIEKGSDDVMKIAEIIGPAIDQMVNEIFLVYKKELMVEPITYVVPAVWGAKKDGDLTSIQKEMNGKIAPVVKQVLGTFELNYLNASQEFAIAFLVRGLIISKLAYMIEGIKNRTTDMLQHQEPMGTA